MDTIRRKSDKPEDIGSGALFKNAKQEKPSHPRRRPRSQVLGERVDQHVGEEWLMSLAFREAEEQ
jgi:hypothetical protein